MIIFRQKQYNFPPDEEYKSKIINSGGTSGIGIKTKLSVGQLKNTSQDLVAQINNQQELMRQKTLLSMNINQIRHDRNEGLADRDETRRNMRVASMTQAKKQASVIGIQNAKEMERKKNVSYITPYKSPTRSIPPISQGRTLPRGRKQ